MDYFTSMNMLIPFVDFLLIIPDPSSNPGLSSAFGSASGAMRPGGLTVWLGLGSLGSLGSLTQYYYIITTSTTNTILATFNVAAAATLTKI